LIYKDKSKKGKFTVFQGMFGYCHTDEGMEGNESENSSVALCGANSIPKIGYY
jgi:hypothetical protein